MNALVDEIVSLVNGDRATREYVRQRVSELAKDATRYRFLRDSENAFPLCFIAQRASPPNIVVQFSGETADRNIDALLDAAGDRTGGKNGS